MPTSSLLLSIASTRAQPTRLERLRSVTLEPMRLTERPAALRALDRLDSVEINSTRQHKGNSQKLFVVDVCFKLSRRRIPVVSTRTVCCRPATPSSSTLTPDAQVERTFSDIRRLRDAVYYSASKDHGLMSCAYCTAIVDLILLRSTTPSTAKQWLQTEAAQCASQTKFLQLLVELAIQVKTTFGGEPCCGQQRIPELVREFLDL